MAGSESLSLWHKQGETGTVVKAGIITSDGCESKSLHHSKMNGIAGEGTAAAHLLAHLVEVDGRNRFQSDQVTE